MEQKYIKIRADFKYLEKGRFYRVFLVKPDVSLNYLGQFIVHIFGGELEHMFLFHTKDGDYIHPSWIEYGPYDSKEKSYLDYNLADLPEKFEFDYDTGDGWDFDCKIYKREVIKECDDDYIPEGFVLDGKGMGIWEDDIGSLYAYAEGEIDPDFDGEDEERGIYKPWNFDIDKYSEFDDPIDIEELSEDAESFIFYEEYAEDR